MYRFFALLILLCTLAMSSCNKDDYNKEMVGPANPMQPNTINFNAITDSRYILWVGGVEVSTAGVNLEEILGSAQMRTFNQDSLINTYFTFSTDSVESNAESLNIFKFPYYFSNDSLFLDIENFTFPHYMAKGDRYELMYERGFIYYSYYYDVGNNGSGGMPIKRFDLTFDNTRFFHPFNNPAMMDSEDTLLIYSQREIYR